jgi:chemotaxis protein MotB
MKNLILILTAGAVLASCSTIYKCGEPRPEKFSAGKRLGAVVNERDSLCTALAAEQSNSAQLTADLAQTRKDLDNTRAELAGLNRQYENLQAESSKTAGQLSAELRAKSDELNRKERVLAEREKTLREMQAIIARQDSITNRLNSVIRDALLGFQADELQVEVKNGKVYVSMSDKLLFRSGSATTEAKGQQAIGALGNVLQKNPDIDILIEGHTDNVPIRNSPVFKDNWDLSTARATSIVRILADTHRIDPKRLTAAGRGEHQPRADNNTPEGRAMNRRTEIILSPKLDELMQLLGQ